jgi:hypothetical protein
MQYRLMTIYLSQIQAYEEKTDNFLFGRWGYKCIMEMLTWSG